MEQTLELSVFRFNADTDFLRYYKEYKVTVTSYKAQRLIDILKEIRSMDRHFSFDTDKKTYVKVNGKTTRVDTSVQELIKCLGTSLKIEPLAENRAVNDLIINDDDFNAKLAIFNGIIEHNDTLRYKEYKHLYYTSDMLRFNPNYIGNAVLALAEDLIKKYPDREVEILEKLCDEESGIWLYTPSCKKFYSSSDEKDLDKKVTSLKRKIFEKVDNEIVNKKRKEIQKELHLTSQVRRVLGQDSSLCGEIKKLWQEV